MMAQPFVREAPFIEQALHMTRWLFRTGIPPPTVMKTNPYRFAYEHTIYILVYIFNTCNFLIDRNMLLYNPWVTLYINVDGFENLHDAASLKRGRLDRCISFMLINPAGPRPKGRSSGRFTYVLGNCSVPGGTVLRPMWYKIFSAPSLPI